MTSMTDEAWEQVQFIVRQCRQQGFPPSAKGAILVASGLLPPSREQGRAILVPSASVRDHWHRIVNGHCDCPAATAHAPCSHQAYADACARGRHPATQRELAHHGVIESQSRSARDLMRPE